MPWLVRREWPSRIFALATCAVGLVVLLAWVLRVQPPVQMLPGMVLMGFNSALLLSLIGAALLVPRRAPYRSHVHAVVGVCTATFAALVLAQDVFGTSFGIDALFFGSWLETNGTPGRMAPNTCVAFILGGTCVALASRRPGRGAGLLVLGLTFVLFTIGVLGFCGHALRLDFLYSWYRYTRMAPHTALGVVLLSAALWTEWKATSWFARVVRHDEEQRILLTATGTLIAVALGAGLVGFSAMQHANEQVVARDLRLALDHRVASIEHEIRRELDEVAQLAARPAIRVAAASGDGDLARLELEHALESGFQSATLSESSNRVLAEAGESGTRALEVPLELELPARLAWDEGVVLEADAPVSMNGARVGTIRAAIPLPQVTNLLQDPQALGTSAVLDLCHRDRDHATCFPTVAEPRVTVRRLERQQQRVPMGYAVTGHKGVLTNVYDTRGKLVVAAHRPFPMSNLGVVLKVDAAELYAPMSKRVQQMLPILVLLVGLGVWLMKTQVSPLVAQIVRSEQRALSAIKDLVRGERQTRAVVDGVSDAIITVDEQGVIRSFNPAATRIFGRDADEMIGQTLEPLMGAELYDRQQRQFQEYLAGAARHAIGAGTMEMKARHRDGAELDIELTVNEVRAGDHRLFVGVLRDISERRRVERLKSEFVATVSHELRTPLTSIRGSLGLIANGVLGDVPTEVKKLVAIAHENSERLVRLVNDILDIEKIEAGRMHFQVERHALQPLVRRAIDEAHGYAEQYQVNVELEGEAASSCVMVDPDRLQQVLMNLLSNAIKYSPRGGVVSVAVEERAGNVRLAVSDRGPGIPAEFRSRIFTKFSQADASDARAKSGTGLGLSIAKAIVDRLGGGLDFEARAGGGTTFYVELPLSASKAPEAESRSGSVRLAPLMRPSILHVEDDPEMRDVIASILEPTVRVIGVASLADARARLAELKFELILLDLELPDGKGQELLDTLDPDTDDCPVMVFTAHDPRITRELASRVSSVVIKTRISEDQFKRKVFELLGISQKPTQVAS